MNDYPTCGGCACFRQQTLAPMNHYCAHALRDPQFETITAESPACFLRIHLHGNPKKADKDAQKTP